MKNLVLVGLLLLTAESFGQILNPVKWNYTANKVSDNKYEIHISAVIQNGWHLFSQKQPADAIAIPTSIKFSKNIQLNFVGKPKEIGSIEKHKEESLGIEQWQYANKVEFVQVVQLKNKIKGKTNVSGTVEFQTCTNEKCLPPKTIEFEVALN